MKIVYGITKSNFGGAQRYVFDLAVEARKRGHDVSVLCGGHGPLVEKLKEEKIKIISLPTLQRNISIVKEVKSLAFIVKTLWHEKPDVFHTNSSKMGGLGNFSARVVGVKKIIFTSHGWAFNEPRPLWQKWLAKFFSWLTVVFSTKTICVSEKTKQNIASWPLIKSKLEVVYNGIEQFDITTRKSQDFTVGTLAELHRVKGLDYLIQAWSIFRQKYPAKLVIYGEGEERHHLTQLAKHLNLEQSIDFKGFRADAREQLMDFDIFTLPSLSENLPYSILEAGLAGLPVVATRVGGIPEIITSLENGLLVNPKSPLELAQAFEELYNDPALRIRLGDKLKKTVIENFSKSQMFEKTFATY